MTTEDLEIPPIDLILWMSLFGLILIVLIPVVLFCKRGPENPASPMTAVEHSKPGLFHGLRVLRVILVSFGLTYIITVVVVAILGGAGLMQGYFFETDPPLGSCTPTCNYEVRNGLAGWTNNDCCTYQQNSSQRDVWLVTPESGYKIHGWIMVNNTMRHKNQPRMALLYNHGAAGNIAMSYRHVRYDWLLEQGNIAIFAYDYPGYGKSLSVDQPTSDSVMEGARSAAVWFADWSKTWDMTHEAYGSSEKPLAMVAPVEGTVNMENITLLGRSMGGFVATYLGVHLANWRVNAVVLQSAVSSIGDLFDDYFPVTGWVLHSEALYQMAQFNNVRQISNYAGCLFMVHSDEDQWVPVSEAKAVWNAAVHKNLSCSYFVELQHGEHTEPMQVVTKDTLQEFLTKARYTSDGYAIGGPADAVSQAHVLGGPVTAVVLTGVATVLIFVALDILIKRVAPPAPMEPDDGDGSLRDPILYTTPQGVPVDPRRPKPTLVAFDPAITANARG